MKKRERERSKRGSSFADRRAGKGAEFFLSFGEALSNDTNCALLRRPQHRRSLLTREHGALQSEPKPQQLLADLGRSNRTLLD